jgi:hypothetical protein
MPKSGRLTVTARAIPDGSPFTAYGRDAWAFLELVKAGQSGCTPIDNPGPRWSAYVHKLKRLHGLTIETITEAHRGPFSGTHARYVLHTKIEILSRSDRPETAVAA